MAPALNRRNFVKGIGLAGAGSVAGCLGGGAGGGGSGGDGGGGGGSGGSGDGGGSGGSGSGGGGRELMMGVLMGVTGGLEQLGPPIRDSALLAAQQINDADVDFTVDTRFEDTQTDPNVAISAAESLASSGYPMIAGALSSTVTLQVGKNAAIPNEVVLMSPASTAPAITDLNDNDFVWRTTPTDALQSQVMAEITVNRLEAETVAIFSLNNDYGQGLAEAYAAALEERGATVQRNVSFEPEQGSYTAPLSQVMQGDPDVLMIVCYPDSGVQIFRDFYTDYDPGATDILVPDGLKDSELPGDVGNPMSNVTGTAPLGAGPGRDKFEEMYQAEFGSSATPYRGTSYDAAAVLLLANAAAGENSGPAVRDQIRAVAQGGGTEVTPSNLPEGIGMAANGEDVNYQGAGGAITFDEAGDIAAATYEYFGFGEDGLHTMDTIEYEE